MQPDYFEVLPIHPHPLPLESLTSYLTRLAEANGILTLSRLQPILFPDRYAESLREMKDIPLKSFDSLSIAAHCSQAALQAITFYPLIKKFGRPTQSVAVAQFLSGHLAPQLRYCPLCLQTDLPHYILPWRFVLLAGCPQHGCRLLDRCSGCGYEIPFLKTPLIMNRCPQCGDALSAGRVDPLDDLHHHQAQARYRDLVFLLSSPQNETELGAIGPRLAYWRKARHRTVHTVADHLKILLRNVRTLERRVPRRGLKFDTYLAYLDYLDLTFEVLFNTVLMPDEEDYPSCLSPEQRFQQRETLLLNQIQRSVDKIHAQGIHLSQEKVSQDMDMPCSSLRTYPRIRSVLTQISQDRQQEALLHKQQREQEWVEKVNRAMENLQAEGNPVTQLAICHRVGMSSKGLSHYPRVKTILLQVSDAYRQRKRLQNKQTLQTLTANVQRSISELKSQGQLVTKKTVAKSIGVSRGILNYYPDIRMLFAQCPEWTGLPPKRPGERPPSQ